MHVARVPFALNASGHVGGWKQGFDRLSPNGAWIDGVFAESAILNPFALSLSKGKHCRDSSDGDKVPMKSA